MTETICVDNKPVIWLPPEKLYCIYSPNGVTPPRRFYTSEEKATAVARKMCWRTGHDFFVLGTESYHQSQVKVFSTYFGEKSWLADAIRASMNYWIRKKKQEKESPAAIDLSRRNEMDNEMFERMIRSSLPTQPTK